MAFDTSARRRESRRVDPREERVLVERLVSRQGLSLVEAKALVETYKRVGHAEIDPALMEGLDTL